MISRARMIFRVCVIKGYLKEGGMHHQRTRKPRKRETEISTGVQAAITLVTLPTFFVAAKKTHFPAFNVVVSLAA